MSQASARAHCHNKESQTCIRSILIVLQQTEQRPQQTSQYQNVFEIFAQPSILAGLVTKGLLTHTQCVSNAPFDVLHKYHPKTQTGPVFCDTVGTHKNVVTNTRVYVRSPPMHDVLPVAHGVSMETLVLENPVVQVLVSMVTHCDMRMTSPIHRRRPHACCHYIHHTTTNIFFYYVGQLLYYGESMGKIVLEH